MSGTKTELEEQVQEASTKEETAETSEAVEEAKPSKVIATPKPKKQPEEDKDSVGIVRCVLVAIFCSVLSVVAYDQFFAQKIVAIDLKGAVDELREQAAAGKITQAEVNAKFDAIQQIVTSTPKHKVILMGDAVVRNVEMLKP